MRDTCRTQNSARLLLDGLEQHHMVTTPPELAASMGGPHIITAVPKQPAPREILVHLCLQGWRCTEPSASMPMSADVAAEGAGPGPTAVAAPAPWRRSMQELIVPKLMPYVLTINLTAASAQGLTIPHGVLLRGDEVVE